MDETDYSNAKVIFVDDEANILNALKRELFEEPFEKYFVSSAKEALKIMRNIDIDVVITDLFMPEMGGLELVSIISRVYPNTVRIILTSHVEVSVILNTIKIGETHRYLVKPWKTQEELLPMIYQGIDLHRIFDKVDKYESEIRVLRETLQQKEEEIEALKKSIQEK